jgi:hypothetical protein
MTNEQLQQLKPRDLVAWHYDPTTQTPALVGTVISNQDDTLKIAWGNNATRIYKYPHLQMCIEQLELLSGIEVN